MDIKYLFSNNENKECVLLLHGWGGNEYSFSSLFNLLNRKYSVIAINLTDITNNYLSKPLTMYDYVLKVYIILQKLNIKHIHIVCHSFGFRIALILNEMFDIDIHSMVIIDGAGIKDIPISTRLKIYQFKMLKLLAKYKLYSKSKLENKGSTDFKNLTEKDKITFKNIVNLDLKSYVDAINCKTTIVWGKYDNDTRFKMAKYLHKKINGSKLKVYNAGHFSYIENQVEFLYDMIEHFEL